MYKFNVFTGNFDLVGSGGGSSYTFTNGLTESGGLVKLGGTLTEDATLIQGTTNKALQVLMGVELYGDPEANGFYGGLGLATVGGSSFTALAGEIVNGNPSSNMTISVDPYQYQNLLQYDNGSGMSNEYFQWDRYRLRVSNYPNTRDDTAVDAPVNFLYTLADGTFQSAPIGTHPITTIAADTTLDVTHYTVLVDASAGNRTATLPAAATTTGRVYHVKKIDSSANQVIIDADGGELIDGTTTQVTTTQWESFSIQSDGTAWFII